MAVKHSGSPDHVRELCRQLKPILGEKMEQVFQAYLAEDETGKTQLEAYLEMLQAKYMPVRLDSVATQLVPPNPAQAYGEYELGTVLYGGKGRGTFGLRENEWIQHVGIFGRTGAGKTNLGFKIVEELVKHGKPCLVLDWKRNYRDLLTNPLFKDAKVYTIGRSIAPFTFNPLIPPPGTNPKTWLKKLDEVIAHSYMLGNGVLYLLQQTLDQLYEEFGVYDGTIQRWPTFQDVLDKARKLDVRGREAGWLSSALRALASLCFGDMGDLVNHPSANSPEELLDQTVVLELDALAQSDKVFVASALLLWIHHRRMVEPTREQFKHAIIIEEAHHLLSDERKSLVGGQSVMEITFRELREFGESLTLLDQHPSQISLPALGNTVATISLNLKTSKDVSAMAQCMLLDGPEKDILGSLEVGQAVVKLQGRVQGPFLIQIPQFNIQKGSVTDEMIQERMLVHSSSDLSRVSRDVNGAETPSPAGPSAPVKGKRDVDDLVLAFLNDVAAHPESGIAERYKRLGISVRQGQKLKFRLLEAGMIEDHEELTHTGRIRKMRLTTKGQHFVATSRSNHPAPQ
jgi:hypothetical protein